jgi:phosphopentomutase
MYKVIELDFDLGYVQPISINEKIFDEIIIIEQNAKKSNFVKSNSIYIDSSFKDRYDVYVYKNINVFDLDMIEILLDIKY